MGSQTCPNCKKGFLIRTSRGTKRCNRCGFTKHDSIGRTSAGTLIKTGEEKKENLQRIDIFEEERMQGREIGKEKGFKSKEFQEYKFGRDQNIRMQKKMISIQEILRDLKKRNKYSNLKTVTIEGEVYDIETGQPISAKKEVKREEEKEPTPSGTFEELVKEETG